LASHKRTGDAGEAFVVANVGCPNCGKDLQRLPESYPLYDVQCSACLFRAQVKSPTSKPKPGTRIRGAGWSILSAALKAGGTVPPMIANYHWEEQGKLHREVRFYPFIERANIKRRPLSRNPDHPRAAYQMFDYVGVSALPHFVLLRQP
jgi:hypothetical protein